VTPPGGRGVSVGLFLAAAVRLWCCFSVTVAEVDVLHWNGRSSMISLLVCRLAAKIWRE